MSNINQWKSVEKELPSIKPVVDSWEDETSSPVLICTQYGTMAVAVYTRFDRDEPFRWRTCCSEGWDISNIVTHWQDLPEKP